MHLKNEIKKENHYIIIYLILITTFQENTFQILRQKNDEDNEDMIYRMNLKLEETLGNYQKLS